MLEGFFVEAGGLEAPVASGGLVDAVIIVGDEAGEADKLTGDDVDFSPDGAVGVDLDVSVLVQGLKDMVFLVVKKGLKVREGEGVESCCKVHEVVGGKEA